jgi:hypothetical protein
MFVFIYKLLKKTDVCDGLNCEHSNKPPCCTQVNASDGFASMAWHGSPSSLGRDPYDCDFGVGFWVGKTALFLSFPYVCPEPVLAK